MKSIINRNTTKSCNFVQVSHDLLRNQKLTINAKMLMIELLSNNDSFVIHYNTIIKRIGLKEKGLRAAFKNLEENNYIIRIKKTNNRGYYYIVDETGNASSIEINEEPKELPQVELSNESDIQLPEEKESPLERLEIEEAIITGFTNNYGQTMVIDEKYINFFNEIIINKKKKIEDLKTYKHNDLFNYRIEELYNDYQDSIEIINTPISFLRK